jgi:hypothetical protein
MSTKNQPGLFDCLKKLNWRWPRQNSRPCGLENTLAAKPLSMLGQLTEHH